MMLIKDFVYRQRKKLIVGLVALLLLSGLFVVSQRWFFQGDTAISREFVDASSNNFPPMNVLDKDENLTGFGRELSDAVIEAVGGEVTHIHSAHWGTVLEWLDSGEADFIHDTGYTADRDEFLDYSDPIIEMQEVIFVRSDQWGITDFEALKGKTVACVNKHITHLYLQNFPDISCKIVDTPVEGLYELVAGQVDAFVYPEQIALYLIQELRLGEKIKITGEPLRTLTWSMTVKEGNQAVLQLLNEGLRKVRKSGEYDRIYEKWWGRIIFLGYTRRELQIIVATAVAATIAVVLSITFLISNLSLRKMRVSLEAEVTTRKQTEAALLESERRMTLAQQATGIGVWDWNILENRAICTDTYFQLYGLDAGADMPTYEEWLERIHPTDREQADRDVREALDQGRLYRSEYRVIWPNGSVHWLFGIGRGEKDKEGNLIRLIGVNLDITERKQLEADALQTQKMDAIGQLAGGIAHDFNNILVPIIGYAEMGMMRLPPDDPLYADLGRINKAAQRAATLTGQILAFSRRQTLDIKSVDLNEIVFDFEKMLGRMIGEDIELRLFLSDALGLVKADRGQVEQILMNLAINARDAMPNGGSLTLETANARLDKAYAEKHIGVHPGPYVMLTVSDTGHGMDTKTQQRIFEPFFTTKPQGKGTGLGLSTVFGLVEQHGGHIWVYSKPGRGATFKIYLPQTEDAASPGDRPATESQSVYGMETVLVVEDEAMVRNLVCETLEAHGYTVLEAPHPDDGLQLASAYKSNIHLLLTDVIMPRLNGIELYKKVSATRPDIKVLFMSGYTDDVIAHYGILDEAVNFLQKPFTVQNLTRKVRQVLD